MVTIRCKKLYENVAERERECVEGFEAKITKYLS